MCLPLPLPHAPCPMPHAPCLVLMCISFSVLPLPHSIRWPFQVLSWPSQQCSSVLCMTYIVLQRFLSIVFPFGFLWFPWRLRSHLISNLHSNHVHIYANLYFASATFKLVSRLHAHSPQPTVHIAQSACLLFLYRRTCSIRFLWVFALCCTSSYLSA